MRLAMLGAVRSVLAALDGHEPGCHEPAGTDLTLGMPPRPARHTDGVGLRVG
ncbi:hypothetical protein ACFWIO_22490 [Streptomyces diastatochromogenes]|uniref:hypothetical protein n=1 Tax=Streptomyces diastatochromogenes TaxID=42236 RepID=UPI0036671BB1